MNDQSKLLERYLMMLRENPNAEPLPELDADLAAFARQMMRTLPSNDALRARVWQKALESQAHPNGSTPHIDYFDKETYPMQSLSIPKRRTTSISWPLLAVAVTVCVIAVWFFIQPPKPDSTSPSGVITMFAMITATNPAETATIIPSATVPPTLTSTPFVESQATPTMIPFGDVIASPMIEITPAAANSAGGTIEGHLSGANPDAVYHFVTTGAGVIAMSVSTNNLEKVNLESSVVHAGSNGGGGGGGGGSGGSSAPLTVQSMSSHMLVLPDDSVTVAVRSNILAQGYSPDEEIPYSLDIRYLDVIDLGSKAFTGTTDGSLSDFNPLALYQFEVSANDIVTIRATGEKGFDTTLELYDASLSPVGDITTAFDYDSGPGYDAEIYRHILPQTGTYYVVVTPGSVGFGAYHLQLTRESVPSLDEGTQTARFNSPAVQQFMFTGHQGEAVTVNIMLPMDALDYMVESVEVTVEQDGKTIDYFNHNSALRLTQAGNVLSGNVTLQSDSPVFLNVNANAKLTQPSSQDFYLEVSVVKPGSG